MSPRSCLLTLTPLAFLSLAFACSQPKPSVAGGPVAATARSAPIAPAEASGGPAASPSASASDELAASTAPPPAIRAGVDRLTVEHFYDPATGFIVARETIALPPLLAAAPPLDAAIKQAGPDRLVFVFVTADRCAPCQQYKHDALNDAAVVSRLSERRFLPTHVEVDRSPELADTHLGTRAIPMTYALRDGRIIATSRGQRSAADLLAWIDALPKS